MITQLKDMYKNTARIICSKDIRSSTLTYCGIVNFRDMKEPQWKAIALLPMMRWLLGKF